MYNSLSYSHEEIRQIKGIVEEVYNILKESLGNRISRFDIAGSLSKRTEVRGLSDVDLLLSVGDEYSGLTPLQVRRILKRVLRDKIKGAKIHNGDMALTILYKKMDIQLIPVVPVEGGKVKVPKSDTSWSRPTDQKIFKNELSNLFNMYQKDSRDKVPRVQKVIKVMKKIEDQRPPNMKLPGYYIENVVYHALKDGKCKRNDTSGVLLNYCYKYASKLILSNISEMSGQTLYVDSCLNKGQAKNRVEISKQLSTTAE